MSRQTSCTASGETSSDADRLSPDPLMTGRLGNDEKDANPAITAELGRAAQLEPPSTTSVCIAKMADQCESSGDVLDAILRPVPFAVPRGDRILGGESSARD